MDYKGYKIIELNNEQLADFYSNNNLKDFLENEYVVITQGNKIVDKGIYQNGKIRRLRAFEIGDSYTDIWKPKNTEQSLAFDLVEDKEVPVKLLTGRYGSGKAQPVTLSIPTPKGWKKLGKIKVGDEVFDRLGRPTKVLKIFPQGKKENYKVVFSDGRYSFCNDEHIWGCVTRGGFIRSFTVKDMIGEGLKDTNGEYKFKIPMCQPVEYTKKQFDLDPYIVGLLFGQGIDLQNENELFCENEEIIKELCKVLNCGYKKAPGKEYNWILLDGTQYKDLYGRLRSNEYTKDDFIFTTINKFLTFKEIPKEYLLGSISQRFSLLQGLLDSSGVIDVNIGKIIFYSPNYKIIKNVQQLYYSLGYITNIVNTYGIATHISVIEKEKLLRIKTKKDLAKNLQISSIEKDNQLFITDIKKLNNKVEMVCILVDNDEHLYLTNDYLVTHNTGILCKAGIAAVRRGDFNKLLWVRNNIEVKDTSPLGSLPGDLLQKMWWTAGPLIDHCGGEFGLERLIEEGLVEIAYLGHLRGRDIRNSLIICSEAENLTKQHIQLLLGRVGEGSNLWLDADLRQRDKQIFEKTAGIENMIEKLKGNSLFGYIHLEKTERSKTACLADLLDE